MVNCVRVSADYAWRATHRTTNKYLKLLQDDLELALEYEIKPILQEYRKDGVLVDREDKLKDKIEALKTKD